MKYVLSVNITSDGDFYYDSKWIQFREDYKDNYWFFDDRGEAVKALKECYNEIIDSFSTSKDYIMNIKNKLKFFMPYLDICLKKIDSINFSLNNGNQELYFTLGTYNESEKNIDYNRADFNINIPENYDWEKLENYEDV